MKNLIYQYWDGNDTSGNQAGTKAMKGYADKIGADYLYEHNALWASSAIGKYKPYFGCFKPLFTEEIYEKYDNVMFADTDVFPKAALTENIFDTFNSDLSIAQEPWQPANRAITTGQISGQNDEKWADRINSSWGPERPYPRDESGHLKVYNSGVVLWSNVGMRIARERFIPFNEYQKVMQGLPAFYSCDQPYLHAMLQVCEFDWSELDTKWNTCVHYIGNANEVPRPVNMAGHHDANFVHIQLRAADHFSEEKLFKITNESFPKWSLYD